MPNNNCDAEHHTNGEGVLALLARPSCAMGAYLDRPNTEKHSEAGSGAGLSYGLSSMQGWRRNMEDDHIAIPELGKAPSGETLGLFAVFDGHGGAEVAKFASKHMPDILRLSQELLNGDYRKALVSSFQAIDDRLETPYGQLELKVLLGQASTSELLNLKTRNPRCMERPPIPSQNAALGDAGASAAAMQQQQKMNQIMLMKRQAQGGRVMAGGGAMGNNRVCQLKDHPVHAGCTAVVTLRVGNRLFTANCGDSRAVLCRAGKALPLSFDHKPNDQIEMNRIVGAGGFITEAQGHFRINGNLNLSRSLGDLKYKQNPQKSFAEQIITAHPDITEHVLSPQDEFMILACDGVWDVLSNDEAVAFVRERLQRNISAKLICEQVFDRCIATNPRETRGIGGDNMTCVIVRFDQTSQGR